MTEMLNQLSKKLSDMYHNAPNGESVAMIHLFGIMFAEDIQSNNLAVREIIKHSVLSDSYATELSKGIKLARYVKPK
jgi:hypothetical protein